MIPGTTVAIQIVNAVLLYLCCNLNGISMEKEVARGALILDITSMMKPV